jgi:hypothetical protein
MNKTTRIGLAMCISTLVIFKLIGIFSTYYPNPAPGSTISTIRSVLIILTVIGVILLPLGMLMIMFGFVQHYMRNAYAPPPTGTESTEDNLLPPPA